MGRALRTGTLFLFLRRSHATLIRPHVLVLKENTLGKDGPLVRQVGGIPIPEGDFQAIKAYMKAVAFSMAAGR